MFYGVQYYPEHWPEERWAVDARMMQEAGINSPNAVAYNSPPN